MMTAISRHIALGSHGQALVELAIMGSLGLMALAFFIQIGLRLNYQQELQQQTFRRALLMAKCEGDEEEPIVECVTRAQGVNDDEESQATVLNHFRDRQMPNPLLGFGIRPRTTTSASATVTWGERLTFLADDRDSQPRLAVRLNDQQRSYRSEDLNENQPFVRRIEKELQTDEAEVNQTGMVTSLSTQTTERTTLRLGTNRDPEMTSTITSNCHVGGGLWLCN